MEPWKKETPLSKLTSTSFSSNSCRTQRRDLRSCSRRDLVCLPRLFLIQRFTSKNLPPFTLFGVYNRMEVCERKAMRPDGVVWWCIRRRSITRGQIDAAICVEVLQNDCLLRILYHAAPISRLVWLETYYLSLCLLQESRGSTYFNMSTTRMFSRLNTCTSDPQPIVTFDGMHYRKLWPPVRRQKFTWSQWPPYDSSFKFQGHSSEWWDSSFTIVDSSSLSKLSPFPWSPLLKHGS